MRAIRLVAAVVLSSVLLTPGLGVAAPTKQEVAQAQKADREGQRLEKKKKFEEAREAYLKSLEIRDSPETRIRLAHAEEELGHLLEAADHLRTVLEAKKLSFVSRSKAKNKLAKLEKRIPTLSLELPKSFSGSVWVDDEEVSSGSLSEPIPVNPGSHTVRAEASGFQQFSESIQLEEKDKKSLKIAMIEAPTEAPVVVATEEAPKDKKSSSGGGNALAWVSIGVGVVGVGVGTFFALKSRSTKSDLDDRCNDGVCSENDRELYDKGKSQANVATVGFAVGAVGIGLGTVLLLTGGKGKAKAETGRHVTPVVGPGNVGLHGVF
jgi:hypothetical protein